MVPNAGEIVRRRWTVATILRLVALFLTVFSLVPLFSWLREGLADGDLLDMSYYADRVVLLVVCLFLGGVLFFAAGFFARLMVPVRRFMRCPGCKNRIEGLVDARCTECGLLLTKDFIQHESLTVRMNGQRPYRVLVFRERVAWFFRVAGVFLMLLGLLYLAGTISLVSQWIADGAGGEYAAYYAGEAISGLLATLVVLGFALFMLIAPKLLARFCVPYRGIDAEP